MKRKILSMIVVSAVASCAFAPSASAADFEPSEAEILRDDVLYKTLAWRTKSAETTLKKHPELETTQPYLTAEAFVMATYSLEQNENFVLKALSILEKQVEKDPLDPVAEFYRGVVLNWLERKDEANEAWQKSVDKAHKAVKKNARNCTARYYEGAALVRLRRADDAKKALKRAAKDDFDSTMVDFQLGLVYLIQQNWNAAKKSFDDVHEIDPRFAHLYFYRGLAWDKLGRKDQLLEDLDQFVKLAPNSPEARTAKAILKR